MAVRVGEVEGKGIKPRRQQRYVQLFAGGD